MPPAPYSSTLTRRGALLVAAVLAAFLLSGCGGKESPSVAGQAAAKVRFQRRAEALCKPGTPMLLTTSRPVVGRNAKRLRREQAQQLDDLRRLGAPAKDRPKLEAYFQATEAFVRYLPSVEAASRGGDAAAMSRSVQHAALLQKRASSAAHGYGLKDCGANR